MKITEEMFKKAEREGSAREFLFALLKELKGDEFTRREFKSLNHEKVVLDIVRENGLERFFTLSGSKNIYNALRKAFRLYFRSGVEKEWNRKLASWREEFENLISGAVARYFVEAGSISRVQKLALSGWIVPPYAVKVYDGGVPQNAFKPFLNADFLKVRFGKFKTMDFLKPRSSILEGILSAFLSGHVELSIYGLFVQIEGVVWDVFVKNNPVEADIESLIRKRNRKFITVQYALKLVMKNFSVDERVPEIFDCVKFVDFIDDGRLNRNAVMHGISIRFGSRDNFLRLFLMFDFFVYLASRVLNGNCTK
ncbi:hypothetical protein [Desulfurobacterium sp.]